MKSEKKLELNRDTIRHLTEDELGDVDAAGTVGCTWVRCYPTGTCTCGNPCNTVAPTEEC